MAMFDQRAVKGDFPIFRHNPGLVFLDTGASAQKPQVVIDSVADFYARDYANIHRGVYALSQRATAHFEHARETVQRFINARQSREVVFVRGATEAINLIANSYGNRLQAGDEILITEFEHHANIVPWQFLRDRVGIKLVVAPMDDTGGLDLARFEALLSPRTKLVAVTQVSNALGTVLPVEAITRMAHRAGALVLVDGCQAAPRMPVDVQEIGCDFYVFSGHKTYGPSGIGVLWARAEILDDMPPWQGGGSMISDVTFERTVFQPPPSRFEAGTGNIADAVGLGAAIDYVTRVGIENIARYEHDLLSYATSVLQPVPGVRLIGTAKDKASVLSFVLKGYETEEVGQALNEEGIAVRSGHHCAQPILRRFGVEATVRPSLAFYNTCDEVDALVSVVRRLSARR